MNIKIIYNRNSTVSKIVDSGRKKMTQKASGNQSQFCFFLYLLHLENEGRHVFTPLLFKYHTLKKIK